MAEPTFTRETRVCAICGGSYFLNPRYSAKQKARSQYCSHRCAGLANPRDRKPISELFGGKIRFGKLTLVGEGAPRGLMRRGLFRCDCGTEKSMGLHHIKQGRTISCGCESSRRASARFTKHGGYRTPEYKSWNAMMQRCCNPNNTSYPDYGARGIKVCEQWQGGHGFLQFCADLGPRPKGRTLDRIEVNGNYEPGNVRWETPKRQQNNRRCSKILTLNGVSRTQKEWADALGLSKNAISERLRKGWTVERALSTGLIPLMECGRLSQLAQRGKYDKTA